MICKELTTLTDLREPVPFTYFETLSNINDCNNTLTIWRTAVVNGTSYSGQTVTYVLTQGATTLEYVFPDLLLTLLKPGEVMTQVLMV
jgi:hypothetical protein